jgi:hypothetical protein
VTFSEPVSWLANSSSSAAAAASGAAANIPASYSSSRILMQNAAVLNISMVQGAGAVLADGSTSSAGSAFLLWLRSWSGAQAQVQIQGAAYQDIAGNMGQQDTTVAVSDACCKAAVQGNVTFQAIIPSCLMCFATNLDCRSKHKCCVVHSVPCALPCTFCVPFDMCHAMPCALC